MVVVVICGSLQPELAPCPRLETHEPWRLPACCRPCALCVWVGAWLSLVVISGGQAMEEG